MHLNFEINIYITLDRTTLKISQTLSFFNGRQLFALRCVNVCLIVLCVFNAFFPEYYTCDIIVIFFSILFFSIYLFIYHFYLNLQTNLLQNYREMR